MSMRMKQMMAPPPPRKELSDNPVKLCNEIARIFRCRMRECEHAEGIMSQPGAHLVLSVLAIQDGSSQLELVTRTHLRAPTVSVILKKMELEGIVERKGDEKDRRGKRVYLTEKGRALDREHIERIQALDGLAMEGLSEEEREVLMRGLLRIRDNLLRDERESK